jgi:hypothetical protein
MSAQSSATEARAIQTRLRCSYVEVIATNMLRLSQGYLYNIYIPCALTKHAHTLCNEPRELSLSLSLSQSINQKYNTMIVHLKTYNNLSLCLNHAHYFNLNVKIF